MSKDRLDAAFRALSARGEKAFAAYMMAGDGGLEALGEQIRCLEDSGVSLIEIGIPFSDPVADGPVIQQAGRRALAGGTTLAGALETLLARKRAGGVPLVIMTYFNPILRYGIDRFAEACAQAGASGAIVPDLPLEEESELREALRRRGLALIRLVAPTSTDARIAEIVRDAEGFVYAVAVKGITGARSGYDADIEAFLQRVHSLSPVPVLAGFGVSTRAQAEQLGRLCDGVIVGSRIVELLHEGRASEIGTLIPRAPSN